MNNDTIPFEDSIFINQEAKYILSLLNEDTKSSSWLLTNGIHKIGRLETKEIILDDITVSRNHAFISVDDEIVTITDEKSTNGIFVNGELTEESVLKSGFRIQIGKFNLIITKVDKKRISISYYFTDKVFRKRGFIKTKKIKRWNKIFY